MDVKTIGERSLPFLFGGESLDTAPIPKVGGPYATSREFFLRGLSACYFAAFASFLLQVPGLYGPRGIIPAQSTSMDSHCVWGLALSVLGLIGWGNMPVMWGMLTLYGKLYDAAEAPFYNFQWDILLLEVGFVAAVLAPWVHSSMEPRPSRAAIWMLRFILFKLMLMSGVVKLTEGDSSWTELTAIWYHFATQCIPTPFAWFFHNLPMPLEKLFCATCFAIEIPASFLILVPVHGVQVLAALLQIMLQLVIIITGNYTFFNYLTIFIACVLLQDCDFFKCIRPADPCVATAVLHHIFCGGKTSDPIQPQPSQPDGAQSGATTETAPLLQNTPQERSSQEQAGTGRHDAADSRVADHESVESAAWLKLVNAMGLSHSRQEQVWIAFTSICFVACVAWTFFFSFQLGFNLHLEMSITPYELLQWTSYWVPMALMLMSLVIPMVTLFDIFNVLAVDAKAWTVGLYAWPSQKRKYLWPFVPAAVLVAVVLMTLRGMVCQRLLNKMPYPLMEIAPSLQDPGTRISLWSAGHPQAHGMLFGLRTYGPEAYGLFRAMTGIAGDGSVARPEVIVEVMDSNGAWKELQFRYKPGDIYRRPPIIAPYQPRLDWQMWFQALSNSLDYWFKELIEKIKEGSPEVLALLDVNSLPDTEVISVRAVRYTYNFTRYGQAGWWQRERVGAWPVKHMPQPINLAKRAAALPFDWRPLLVWAFLFLALILWLLPYFPAACLALSGILPAVFKTKDV